MRRPVLLVAVALILPVSASAKDYTAQRFDVTIRTLDDGSVQVTETVRLTFQGGPFTYVSREIPLRKTDGIEVLGASMDGHVMRRGGDPGQFDVRIRESRVAVRWHFAATGDATHDFRLSYLAHGVVQQSSTGPLLQWQALPGEHRYTITTSRITVEGVALDREPSLRTRRVGSSRADRTPTGWVIDARDIGSDGWVTLAAPATVAADVVARWQQREQRQRALAPRLFQVGVIAMAGGVVLVLLIWRQYPTPPLLDSSPETDSPPANRPPAIAAAIVAGGHSSNSHAPGTLLDLASRNVVSVAESERGWKPRRRFTLTRKSATALAPHEAALLELMFRGEATVEFSRAASRLARRGRSFRHAVNEELHELGLTDDERRSARRRLFIVGLTLAMLSVAAAAVVIATAAGPSGLAIPLGTVVAAALALVLAATRAELSDEGFREREKWRGFRKRMKGSIGSESSILPYLPYLAAMGLGLHVSRYLKSRGADAALPPWFHTLAESNGSAAFAAFVGSTSYTAGGAGAVGSGASGGGSSSAG